MTTHTPEPEVVEPVDMPVQQPHGAPSLAWPICLGLLGAWVASDKAKALGFVDTRRYWKAAIISTVVVMAATLLMPIATIAVLGLALSSGDTAPANLSGSGVTGTQQQAPQPAPTQEQPAVLAFTPSQAAPLPAPAGLSDEALLDWRLVQRDKVYPVVGQYDASTNSLITPATIDQDTATWVKIINTQTSILPASDTAFASTFKGHPWAADNVVFDVTSDMYPKMIDGALVPASIVENTVAAVQADGADTSGPVRFFTAMLRRPGMADVKHTFAFYWHEASDHVGRPIIAVCRITTNLTPQTC